MNSGNFNGELGHDSPALLGEFKRALDRSLVSPMALVYRRVFEDGGTVEDDIVRESGVSFNPRAARFTLLILKETPFRDATTIGAAMIASLDTVEIKDSPDFTPEMVELAKKAKEFQVQGSVQAEAIALAMCLDKLRHLHMTSLAPHEIVDAVTKIKEAIVTIKFDEKNRRLTEMVNSAIARIERQQRC